MVPSCRINKLLSKTIRGKLILFIDFIPLTSLVYLNILKIGKNRQVKTPRGSFAPLSGLFFACTYIRTRYPSIFNARILIKSTGYNYVIVSTVRFATFSFET